MPHGQKKQNVKQKQYSNRFSEDLKKNKVAMDMNIFIDTRLPLKPTVESVERLLFEWRLLCVKLTEICVLNLLCFLFVCCCFGYAMLLAES